MTAINKALYFPTASTHYTSDGEGFEVYIMALEKPEYDGKDIQFPYTDAFGQARWMNEDKTHPWYVWKGLRQYFGLKP
jgi:hypothetical protein